MPLTGVTAALKLPAGFKATAPLTDAPNRWDIALAQWRGVVLPGQGITLYFMLNILPTAKVGLPVLGPLALHFLRPNTIIYWIRTESGSNQKYHVSFQNLAEVVRVDMYVRHVYRLSSL